MGCLLAHVAAAQATFQTFQLTDGKPFGGRAIQFTDAYVQLVLEAPSGTYTNVRWGRFTQDSLKLLTKDPRAEPFAKVFIDVPSDRPAAPQTKNAMIEVKPVPRLDRPAGGGLFASPVMLLLFFLIYLGNLFAAYEISIFRQQPPGLVCGLAAILPVLGPIIFIAMPTRRAAPVAEAPPEVAYAPVEELPPPPPEDLPPPPRTPVHTGPVIPPPVVFQRGTSTFNRRFFETKMASFLRVVPSEGDKDMVVFIKSSRGDYAGRRISKIGPEGLSLLVQTGNASEEVLLPFMEINEVQIKHKDS